MWGRWGMVAALGVAACAAGGGRGARQLGDGHARSAEVDVARLGDAAAARLLVVDDAAALLAAVGRAPAAQPGAPAADGGLDPSVFWNRLTSELGYNAGFAPPRLGRAYLLVHAAIHDALVVSSRAGAGALRARPVAAAAAATVLAALFNRERDRLAGELASEAADARPDETELGRRVGARVVERDRAELAPLTAPSPPAPGTGVWSGINPLSPEAGLWPTWFVASAAATAPEPPYALGSAADRRDLDEVAALAGHRSARDVAVVHKWHDTPPPTIWNDLANERIVAARLPPLAAARALVYLNGAMYDAFVVCWNAKFRYWGARPSQRIAGLATVVPTPNFPTYTSGHATVSGAASVVLSALFPRDRSHFAAAAEEAAWSRLIGGIHFRHDNEAGLASGRRTGAAVVARMQRDGLL